MTMSAHTVITHAQNQGAPLSWPMGSTVAPVMINLDKAITFCDFCDARPTFEVQASVEGAWRYVVCPTHARQYAVPTGVSLAKEGDPVRPVPAAPTGPIRTTGEGWVSYVPRGEWAGLIRAALRHSQYAYASGLSAAFHAGESA